MCLGEEQRKCLSHMYVDNRRGLSDHSGTKGLPYPYCYCWKATQSASTTSASISTIALEPFPFFERGEKSPNV